MIKKPVIVKREVKLAYVEQLLLKNHSVRSIKRIKRN